MRFFDNSAKNLVQSLPLKGCEHVLDAATGTGKIALGLARRLKKGRVTAVDMSDGMLRVAKKKAAAAHLTNISFVNSDVDELHFPRSSFDGLTCGFGVHFWDNMEKSLARLATLVKNGGFVAITSFAKGAFEPHASLCLDRFRTFGVKLPKSYSVERLDRPNKNKKLFKDVGLRDITCSVKQVGYHLKSAKDWWDLVLFTGYRAFLSQLSRHEAKRFKKEFIADVEATKGSKGVFLNVEVITTIGRVRRA